MDRIAETLEVMWDQLSPTIIPTLVILISLIVAGVIFSVVWFSIARIVWLHKHPSWTLKEACDHLFPCSVT